MESLGMTQRELAKRTGLAVQSLNRIFKGEQPITTDTATILERVTDVPAGSFQVRLVYENSIWKLIMKDSGCGMSAATRSRMFEPFHTTKSKGTGLGLAVTHKILEGHGAQIFVDSEQGVGTTFTLQFPAVNA